AVEELKSFSLAAEKCCVTQSTLSTMIGKLEDEMGIKIFDRKTKPISLTKEGKIVLQQLGLIAKEVNVLGELVQSLKGELTGILHIGILATVAPYILPTFLNDFAQKFPDIAFSISEMTTKTITERLLKRELDVGILATPIAVKDLIEMPLYQEPFVLYDCTDINTTPHVQLEEIDFSNFWLLEESHCLSTQVKRICDLKEDREKAGINFDFKTGSIDSLIRFVHLNKGVTMLPYLASLDLTAAQKEKIKYFQPPVPVRAISLVVHQHFVKKQILALLKAEIQEKVAPLLVSQDASFVVAPV
ncbi:MAG: LysR substrate-binding domain-containing protein, partial [Bacteroidota bacterium]